MAVPVPDMGFEYRAKDRVLTYLDIKRGDELLNAGVLAEAFVKGVAGSRCV